MCEQIFFLGKRKTVATMTIVNKRENSTINDNKMAHEKKVTHFVRF